MNSLIQLPGAHYDANKLTANRFNRTAATTVLGGVGFVDVSQSDGDSTTVETALDNVVAVTTALMAKRPPLVVCTGIAADNDRIDWIEGDGVVCLINVDSTTDIAKGDWLKPVNAGDHMVKATAFSVNESGVATDTLTIVYAQALEARTADTEGTIRCLLYSSGRVY